uniref:Uncharacterized protein n=1 Tax=Oryza meridionalis TaxID=40149 RepID=A0A0E0DRC3_9ORYZ
MLPSESPDAANAMEPGNAMDSAIEYARVSSDAMDSGARVDAAYQSTTRATAGSTYLMAFAGDALKANITAMGAPGAAHLGRDAVRAPPSSCCLSAEAHHGHEAEALLLFVFCC